MIIYGSTHIQTLLGYLEHDRHAFADLRYFDEFFPSSVYHRVPTAHRTATKSLANIHQWMGRLNYNITQTQACCSDIVYVCRMKRLINELAPTTLSVRSSTRLHTWNICLHYCYADYVYTHIDILDNEQTQSKFIEL